MGRILTVNPTLILYFYDSRSACLIYPKFWTSTQKRTQSPPKKSATPQRLCISRSPAWRQHFVRPHPDATRHEKRALRLCCVGRGGESATPQPMSGMACRETLRRGGNFLGCRGRTIATFLKKVFAEPSTSAESVFRGSFRPIKFIDKHITPEDKELKY